MADKEATVFVIDLGASMGYREHDPEMTNLEWAMQYVWDKVAAKVGGRSFDWQTLTLQVLAGRKTDVVGVVGFRTTRSCLGDLF